MLLKTEINLLKKYGLVLCASLYCSSTTFAQNINCEQDKSSMTKVICSSKFDEQRSKFNNSHLTAYLITDAPLRLLNDTHHLWLNQLKQCKSSLCYSQQIDARIDQLNFFTSMNQSLTQHYLKFENGKISKMPVHLQIHQLSKDNIKIEGIAYKNPNNRLDSQTLAFLAYTTTDKKNEITNNETDCKYQFNFTKAYLSVKTQQKNCDRFTGIYRLYD